MYHESDTSINYNGSLTPRPNDRNMLTQHCWAEHVACVWPPCCDMLRHVGCCWLKFEAGQIFHATFLYVVWCCSRFARFVQECCTRAFAIVRFSIPNMSQHVATGWENARTMLRPTMLYVVLKCCDRLAGACSCWPNIVAIFCVDVLSSFGRGFTVVKPAWIYVHFYKCKFPCLLPFQNLRAYLKFQKVSKGVNRHETFLEIPLVLRRQKTVFPQNS